MFLTYRYYNQSQDCKAHDWMLPHMTERAGIRFSLNSHPLFPLWSQSLQKSRLGSCDARQVQQRSQGFRLPRPLFHQIYRSPCSATGKPWTIPQDKKSALVLRRQASSHPALAHRPPAHPLDLEFTLCLSNAFAISTSAHHDRSHDLTSSLCMQSVSSISFQSYISCFHLRYPIDR